MPAVDAEMVFIAESRNREIDPRFAVRARLGLGVLERPARVAILLPQLGWLACPVGRDTALLDLTLSPALLRCFGAATIEASMI